MITVQKQEVLGGVSRTFKWLQFQQHCDFEYYKEDTPISYQPQYFFKIIKNAVSKRYLNFSLHKQETNPFFTLNHNIDYIIPVLQVLQLNTDELAPHRSQLHHTVNQNTISPKQDNQIIKKPMITCSGQIPFYNGLKEQP